MAREVCELREMKVYWGSEPLIPIYYNSCQQYCRPSRVQYESHVGTPLVINGLVLKLFNGTILSFEEGYLFRQRCWVYWIPILQSRTREALFCNRSSFKLIGLTKWLEYILIEPLFFKGHLILMMVKRQ